MIGNPSDPGIMVRVMGDLFTYCQKDGNQHGIQYKVTVSFLEVYNENIRDLLSDVEEYLDLREDPIKGPMVAGITEVETASSREIMDLLQQGNARRSQQATAANEAGVPCVGGAESYMPMCRKHYLASKQPAVLLPPAAVADTFVIMTEPTLLGRI